MNYQFNSYVNRREAEQLKEMIFRRARERAQSFTGDVQADIMSVARESFVSQNNPFSQIIATTGAEETKSVVEEKEEEVKTEEVSPLHEYVEAAEKQAEQVGFTQKNLHAGAVNQNRFIQEQTSARQIQDTMREAREGLTNKKSFMGALAFLNSQAAVSLFRSETGGLEVVA